MLSADVSEDKKIKKLNLDIASDYLVMAAVLAYIKSKLLLPSLDTNDDNKIDLPEILEFNLKRLSAIREKSSKLRNAKIRLSNIKLEAFTQVMRGKSKWIKH